MATGFHADCTCERQTLVYLVTPPGTSESRQEMLCPFCAAQARDLLGYTVEGPMPAIAGAC